MRKICKKFCRETEDDEILECHGTEITYEKFPKHYDTDTEKELLVPHVVMCPSGEPRSPLDREPVEGPHVEYYDYKVYKKKKN